MPAQSTTLSASEEGVLVHRLKTGDEAAFEELVRNHGGRMLALARRFLRNDDDARDVVQESMLSAFKAIQRFDGNSLLSTWLHRIVTNAALMKLRTRQRHPEEAIEDLLPTFLPDGHHAEWPADWKDATETLVERNDTRRLVRECIDRLPETYRTVLLLRDIEEFDTEEAATMLGISANALKIRLHRARLALRTLLDPHLRVVE